jgi:hypothetical protein
MPAADASQRANASLELEHNADRRAGLAGAEVSRRSVLRALFLGLGAASMPSWVLEHAVAHAQAAGGPELGIPLGPLGAQDYGPLVEQAVADHLASVDHQLFAPQGFSVRVVMRAGVNPLTLDTSGTLGHVNPDGGAVFPAPDGGWVYVSNSETGSGGVSSLRFDAAGNLVDYYRICAGTRSNCAGGATPWGTWITCEETTSGWAYECDPFGTPSTQRRLSALGARNGREAVAIDPIYHACYQTLDTSSGKFVRFVSNPVDLESTPSGIVRMRMLSGISQRLYIPPTGSLPGYANALVPNTATGSSRVRQARPIQWLADSGSNGTNFNGSEGIWYFEIPEELRTVPGAGTLPTRGVVFFATKGDNRIWAIDIENSLIELIYDTQNSQAFANLRPGGPSPTNYNQVDNAVVSPAGDVLVAEDGTAMRLAIVANGVPPKLLMQITRGGSEITGPAFTPDGSRLYFSSQRGPSGPSGSGTSGVTYEMTIPPEFRALQQAQAFAFRDEIGAPAGASVSSEAVRVGGFAGWLPVRVRPDFGAELSIEGGPWSSRPASIRAGQSLRVRHTSSSVPGEARASAVTIGHARSPGRTVGTFVSVTASPDRAETR